MRQRVSKITSEPTKFRQSSGGLLTSMSRLPLAVTKEMFFTSEPISAARAERAGLVNAIDPGW